MMVKMIVGLFLLLITDWIGAKSVDNLSLRATADTGCEEGEKEEARVFLTVSSLAWIEDSVVTKRQLELNWKVKNPKRNDTVALYGSLPCHNTPPLERVRVMDYPEGYYRTKVELPSYTFTKENISYGCLNYYIGYVTENKITHLNCLKTRPKWMNEIRQYIENLTLTEMMIPGTHDSGSYSSFPYHLGIPWIAEEYVFAQEENIFNQLTYGIRYLDLRVISIDGEFIIKHGIVATGNTLRDVLSDVRDFVEATNEIVILDFHKFPSTTSVLKELIAYVKNKLNPHLIPRGSSLKIGDIFNTSSRILVSFNGESFRDPEIWPPVCQIWADVKKLDKLRDFFVKFYNSSSVPSFLWSAMAELTPDTEYIFEHYSQGLRELADTVNRPVTRWFSGEWGASSNIVATDYFLGNNIVEVSNDINRKKICGRRKSPAKNRGTFTCSPAFDEEKYIKVAPKS